MAEYNGEENLHMSDVMEVIQNDEIGGTILDDDMHTEMEDEFQGNSFSPIMEHHHLQNESHRPYIEILEQPASGIRFRYEIEGRSAGSIPGENSRPDMKTYPTIRVVGYTGSITIVVSCVTVEDNPNNRPRAHPHKLVGRAESCKNGVCRVRLRGDNMTVSFPNLGIQCVRRKDVEASLTEREKERVDPFAVGFEHRRTHANIALNVVRLCFQGFIPRKINGKKDWEPLAPVVSNPIVEKKATCTLSIHKLSHYCASVAGGMEMILLCDKVPRDDIQIRFYEERDGRDWEGYGEFQPAHVHHQYAISFRTPKYDNMDITEPVKVKIQLKLKKKDQGGPPLDFEMLPLGTGRPAFWSLRKAFTKKMTDHSAFDKLLSADNNTLLSHFNPKISRTIDEYNNNNDDLNLKRSQEKFSALRALNDLYNVRNNLQSQNSIVPSKLNLPIKKTISDNIDLENSIMKNDPLIENSSKKIYESTKSQWFNNKNNSEIGKWVEKTQEFQKKSENNHIVNIENENSKSNDERALNELLTQVAELDQIYADTNTKLLSNNVDLNLHEIDIHDNMTYTSLQMAMKNPIELFDLKNNDKDDDNEKRNYDDVPINSPIIAISNNNNNNNSNNNVSSAKRDDFDERLPPLPPKRIRKTPSMPVLSVAMAPIEVDVASSSSSSFRNDGAPNKNLPSPPGTLPKQAKQGLFSKLFAKKQKKERDTMNIKQLPNVSDSLTSLKNNNDQIAMHNNIQLPRPSMTSITSVKSLKFDGDESPPYGIELTEAENYALYTDMAPHATASEFDELSFYYSPVEGGKIFTKET